MSLINHTSCTIRRGATCENARSESARRRYLGHATLLSIEIWGNPFNRFRLQRSEIWIEELQLGVCTNYLFHKQYHTCQWSQWKCYIKGEELLILLLYLHEKCNKARIWLMPSLHAMSLPISVITETFLGNNGAWFFHKRIKGHEQSEQNVWNRKSSFFFPITQNGRWQYAHTKCSYAL